MADVVTFDPLNLWIIEIDTGLPVNELSAQEIYSEWKDWLLANSQRLGYPQAFTPVGGDPITPTKSLGITLFLENGWRIKPAEYDHKLVITGNLFAREPGASIFRKTVGTFNVHTESSTSNLIDQVSGGSGLSPEQVTWLRELWLLRGLDPAKPLVVTSTSRRVPSNGGDIDQTVSESSGTVTITRVP